MMKPQDTKMLNEYIIAAIYGAPNASVRLIRFETDDAHAVELFLDTAACKELAAVLNRLSPVERVK